MDQIDLLAKLTNPIGGQDIELQDVHFEAGGMNMLRVRIREGKRFTIFDIDRHTAGQLAAILSGWAEKATGA